MTLTVPTPSAKALAKLPRQQLLELQERIREALGETEDHRIWKNANVVGVRLTLTEKRLLMDLAAAKDSRLSDELRSAVRHYLKEQNDWLSRIGRFTDDDEA